MRCSEKEKKMIEGEEDEEGGERRNELEGEILFIVLNNRLYSGSNTRLNSGQ